jgi:hypothetical protein
MRTVLWSQKERQFRGVEPLRLLREDPDTSQGGSENQSRQSVFGV